MRRNWPCWLVHRQRQCAPVNETECLERGMNLVHIDHASNMGTATRGRRADFILILQLCSLATALLNQLFCRTELEERKLVREFTNKTFLTEITALKTQPSCFCADTVEMRFAHLLRTAVEEMKTVFIVIITFAICHIRFNESSSEPLISWNGRSK